MASHAYSTDASMADAFRPTLLRIRRRALEDWIERAIALLDRLDPDPDDEPSLGWSRTMAIGTADDRELDAGDDGEGER